MFRAHRGVGVGWGGACINVHVNLLGRYVRADMGGAGWGGVGQVLTLRLRHALLLIRHATLL